MALVPGQRPHSVLHENYLTPYKCPAVTLRTARRRIQKFYILCVFHCCNVYLMDIIAVWFTFFSLQHCGMNCKQVTRFIHCTESSPFCNSYHLFTLLFLSKQTRHCRNIVSFYFFLFIRVCGRAKCLSSEQCVAALHSGCSLQQKLQW